MTLSGKRISKGIGIGEVLCIRKNFDKIISREKIDFSQVDSEISKFNKAKSKAIEALRDLERKAMLQFGDDKKVFLKVRC